MRTLANFCFLQYNATPTLMNSSRSTRGTTRTTAYSYTVLSLIFYLLYEYFGICYATREKFHINLTHFCRGQFTSFLLQPFVRDDIQDLRSEEHTSELQSRENLVC